MGLIWLSCFMQYPLVVRESTPGILCSTLEFANLRDMLALDQNIKPGAALSGNEIW